MKYFLKNNLELEIINPKGYEDKVLDLIIKLSEESDNFPFTSEDFGLNALNIANFINHINSMDNSIFVIGVIDEKVVALGYLEGGKRERTFHSCNLGIGVLSSFQQLGIGGKIMDYMINFAKEGEYIAKINLQVRVDNKKAIALYKKTGFVLEGKESRAMFIEGEFYDYINMGYLVD